MPKRRSEGSCKSALRAFIAIAMAWVGPYLRQAAAGTTFASRCAAAQRCSQDLAACATFGRRKFASQGDGSSHDEV